MTYDTYARIEELQKRAEAAEAQVVRLREALEPFAKEAERFSGHEGEIYRWKPDKHSRISTGDFVRARAALGET